MLNNSFKLFVLAILLTGCSSEKEMSIVFGGDVMLDRGIRNVIDRKGIKVVFEDIEPIFNDSDFVVVNFENPSTNISEPLQKKFVFNSDPFLLPSLKKAGFTHLILANNHSYDYGRTGLKETAQNIEEAGMVSVGFGASQEESCSPVLLEKDGIKVALFSSVTLPLESWFYLEDQPGMCQKSISGLCERIREFTSTNPDIHVIVSLHWGVEYQLIPTNFQRQQAREIIEAGASAIIGHHPHVIQSYESINGKPVFYSLGNLIFDNQNPITHTGILVKLIFSVNKIKRIEFIPYEANNGIPHILRGREKTEVLNEMQDYSDELPLP